MVYLSEVIDINPESITKQYPHKVIEYVDISSVYTGRYDGSIKLLLANAPSRAKRLVEDGDTILATVRPNLRSFLFFKNPAKNTVVSTGFAVLRARKNKMDKRYLYYIISNQRFTNYLTLNAKGSAYPAVDKGIIERAKIDLPSLKKQEYVAAVLGAYDDLIENNLKRIAILAEIAQLCFSHFQQSTKSIRRDQLGNLLLKAPKSEKVKKSDYLKAGLIPVIDQGQDYIAGYTNNPNALIETALPIVVFGDHTRVIKLLQMPFARGADGTQLLTSNCLTPFYLYLLLKNCKLGNQYYARHFRLLKVQEVDIPPQEALIQFEKLVKPLFQLIHTLTQTNMRLDGIRDLLLPRLMPGEVKA